MFWQLARRRLDLSHQAIVMGILNVTPDSFSDGGQFRGDTGAAVDAALAMLAEGAAILDVGGESTRPGAAPVPLAEELRRVLPVVEAILARAPDALISVDTSKATVADAALAAGAAIVNDVTALRGDPAMAGVVRRHRAGVVLMHMQGEPRTMQDRPEYPGDDIVTAVQHFFRDRLRFAADAGIDPASVALDPGIGFGKTAAHNLTLCRRLDALTAEAPGGCPLVFGVSRKRFLAAAAGLDPADPPAGRDAATVAMNVLAREKGARVLRVHAVRPNVEAVRAAESVLFA